MNFNLTQETEFSPIINNKYNDESMQNLRYNLMNYKTIKQFTLLKKETSSYNKTIKYKK